MNGHDFLISNIIPRDRLGIRTGSRRFWKKVLLFLTMTSTSYQLRCVSSISTMLCYFVVSSIFSLEFVVILCKSSKIVWTDTESRNCFHHSREKMPGSLAIHTWRFTKKLNKIQMKTVLDLNHYWALTMHSQYTMSKTVFSWFLTLSNKCYSQKTLLL